jgi:hypothetical protein
LTILVQYREDLEGRVNLTEAHRKEHYLERILEPLHPGTPPKYMLSVGTGFLQIGKHIIRESGALLLAQEESHDDQIICHINQELERYDTVIST